MRKAQYHRSKGDPNVASNDSQDHGKPEKITKATRPGQAVTGGGEVDGKLPSGHMSPRELQTPHGQPKRTHVVMDDHGANRMQRGDRWDGLPNKAFTDGIKK